MKTLFYIGNWLPDMFKNITLEQVKAWFVYNPQHPLLFNSGLFLGLFLVFYLLYVLTKKHQHFRTVYLLLFSVFFYYKAGGFYVLLLLASGIVNYMLTQVMNKAETKSKRKTLLTLTVVANLGVLGYYKYTNFFIDNINNLFGAGWSLYTILLPIGISFFTFQAISYAVDLYRKEIQPARSTIDFSFYLCFFPQLVAGPIVRAKDFLPQMYRKIQLSKKEASAAVFMILTGLIKKAVISDYISSNFVDRVFDGPMSYTPFENLMAVYGYTLQIYCDFSGYSDMAIGLALLMGFTLPLNFNMPYKSQSVTEFWKRWHISLSSWLRDYLYIPLGGNRKGNIRTYINLSLTMLIGGLWHGAAWKFVVWGGLHGAMLAIERFIKQHLRVPTNFPSRTIGLFFTFNFVAFCWIFFRANSFDLAKQVITNIGQLTFHFNLNQATLARVIDGKATLLAFFPVEWAAVLDGYRNVFLLVMIGYVLHFLPDSFHNLLKKGFDATPLVLKSMCVGIVFWLVFATASSGPQPFIYFQF